MAITANRTEIITLSGDVSLVHTHVAAANAASPGSMTQHTLSSGDNTITLPTGGTTVKSATILPPSGNAQALTLKGNAGDTGLIISLTEPTTLTFKASPASTFILNAGGTVTGLRIVWT
jgi:hypothetical protein